MILCLCWEGTATAGGNKTDSFNSNKTNGKSSLQCQQLEQLCPATGYLGSCMLLVDKIEVAPSLRMKSMILPPKHGELWHLYPHPLHSWVLSSSVTNTYHLASAAINGRLYTLGGRTPANTDAVEEVCRVIEFLTNHQYNPVTNTWTTKYFAFICTYLTA